MFGVIVWFRYETRRVSLYGSLVTKVTRQRCPLPLFVISSYHAPIDSRPSYYPTGLERDNVIISSDIISLSDAALRFWLTGAWPAVTACSILPAWASCQIRKIAGAHAPGMPETFSPSPQVSDPDMHHGTCVTHVPWCMPGSLTSGFLWNWRRRKTFPAFPAHAQPAILRIW